MDIMTKIVSYQIRQETFNFNSTLILNLFSKFTAVKDGGFNPVLEYAGDDATYQSDPGGKPVTNPSSASDEVQPLWTAQVRASLTQIYEKCSVPIPSLLQRPPHLRPLLTDITVDKSDGGLTQISNVTTQQSDSTAS